MKYTRLGSSDLIVSEIAFGGMSLEKDTATALIQEAFEKGITFFDTADIYNKGENERMMGEALRSHRKGIILATKVGNQEKASGQGWDWNPSKAYILESVEKSLKRLQTDYIDLYQLHGGTMDDPMDETIEAFELLKEQGKIRAYGISSIRPNVIQQYVNRSNIASVMMQYSLLDRRPEEHCLDLLAEHNISVLARGSVARGLLAGKTAEPYLNYNEQEVQQAAGAVASLSSSERNRAATAIRYALFPKAVASAVVGIRTAEQLADALEAGEASLSPEEFTELGRVLSAANYQEHRMN